MSYNVDFVYILHRLYIRVSSIKHYTLRYDEWEFFWIKEFMCVICPATEESFSFSFLLIISMFLAFFLACRKELLTFFTRFRSCLLRFSREATFCWSFFALSSSSNSALWIDEHISCQHKNIVLSVGCKGQLTYYTYQHGGIYCQRKEKYTCLVDV